MSLSIQRSLSRTSLIRKLFFVQIILMCVASFDSTPTIVRVQGRLRRLQCPRIKEAIAAGLDDYNQTLQGWLWFKNRGLSSSKHYGCRKPEYAPGKEPRFNFALDCQCPAWSQCTGDAFEYQTSDGLRHSSQMGTCGCCAWWLILLIVIFSLLILASIIKWKCFRDRYREYKKKHRKGDSFKDRGFDSLDDGGEGGSGAAGEGQELKSVVGGGDSGNSPDRLVLPLTKRQQAKYQQRSASERKRSVRIVSGGGGGNSSGEGYATTLAGPGAEGLTKRGSPSHQNSGSRKLSLLPDIGAGKGGGDDDGRGSQHSSRGSLSGSFGRLAGMSGSERPQTPPLPQPGSSAAQILALQRQSLGAGVPSANGEGLPPPTSAASAERPPTTTMDRSESPGSVPPNLSLNETQEFRKLPEPAAFATQADV